MKKLLLLLVFVSCIVLIAGQTTATTLSFSPASQEIAVGDSTAVDLIISGLGDHTAPSLGAFLVEVTYDPGILFFDSVMYGPFLGNTDPFEFETDIITTAGSGFVFLDQFSYLSDSELDGLQSASFTLATLEFTGIGPGSSAVGFGYIDLSDAASPANTLSYDELLPGGIKVAPVPEPATIMLLAGGFGGLAVFRKKMLKK
jgi:hypothetical protein